MAEADMIGQVTGMLQGQGGGAGILANLQTTFMLWMKIGFTIVGIVLLCAVIYKWFIQYNIKITLYKRIGLNSTDVTEDKAKLVLDDQGKLKMVLFKLSAGKKRATCPLPSAIYKSKFGRKDHYHLWVDDNFELHPVIPPTGDTTAHNMTIVPQERSAWSRLEKEGVQKKFAMKDNLMKYAPLIGIGVVCVTTFLIFFFFFRTIGGEMGTLSQQFGQLATSCLSSIGGSP